MSLVRIRICICVGMCGVLIREYFCFFFFIGENTCGMVSWDFELFTPEYPQGRHIVVIANDITFNIGSFGPMEDLVFWRASEYARKLGMFEKKISCFVVWSGEN